MKFRLEYNKKPFGSKTFETYPEAANYLRALLNAAESRYFAAIRSQNRFLTRNLRIIRRRLIEEVHVARAKDVALVVEPPKQAAGFFTPTNIERPKYSSKIRGYAQIK